MFHSSPQSSAISWRVGGDKSHEGGRKAVPCTEAPRHEGVLRSGAKPPRILDLRGIRHINVIQITFRIPEALKTTDDAQPALNLYAEAGLRQQRTLDLTDT